ncbi:telomerase RNA component interacting RNase isoform X1 [Alligator mississippiensis]|uniref:telomerase RNA component interacting RNase isoform X1 n=1 Tax=Alligator mississippiensis TaxID=8496 RepID=UPI002877E407|nr:telomerase RNA component interacting RNase isoform X1 [Alligator mississippiensis]
MAAQGERGEAVPRGPGGEGGGGGGVNVFANDGSFLELFKRRMEAEQRGRAAPDTAGPGAEAGAGSGAEQPPQQQQQHQQQQPPAAADGRKKSGGALGFLSTEQVPSSCHHFVVVKPSSCLTLGVGRRRGGNKLALKTGVVAKKQKMEEEVLTSKGDAWAKYMAEVKKYKAHQCSDDDKTRPLVK